jgi:hypothetical protein
MAKKLKIDNKTKRTRAELQQASKHLFWGMRYLSEKFEFILRYAKHTNKDDARGIINSITDSFLIHARKMVDFLCNESLNLYDDDVVAEDYFDDPVSWRSLRPNQSDIIRQTKNDINKLLAHFTYELVNYPDGRLTWSVSDVYVEIFQILQIFLREAPPALLDKSLDLLKAENPMIIICHPIYPPIAKAPYQIQCTRDRASNIDVVED